MRSLINAITNFVVNGRLDRTNVAGIGSLRDGDLRLCPRFYATCAQHAYAHLPGMKHQMPAHPRAHMVESTRSAMAEAPCWRPEQSFIGSLAFACTS